MPKKYWSIEVVISIFSLLAAIIAIAISIQSNQIANRQVEAQIVIFDDNHVRSLVSQESRTDGGEKLVCSFGLRVVNLGGDIAAITGFRTEISYKGSKIIADSEGTKNADNTQDKLDDFFDFHTLVIQSLPITIDSYSEIELTTLSSFSHPANTNYYFLPSQNLNAEPITYRFTLKLASGKEVQSPKLPCTYISLEAP